MLSGCCHEDPDKLNLDSAPGKYDFCMITKGKSRKWTYPSGPKWNIFAVSLHNSDNPEEDKVSGGLCKSDKKTFVVMRPREKDYDILTIDAEDLIMQTGKTLRETLGPE